MPRFGPSVCPSLCPSVIVVLKVLKMFNFKGFYASISTCWSVCNHVSPTFLGPSVHQSLQSVCYRIFTSFTFLHIWKGHFESFSLFFWLIGCLSSDNFGLMTLFFKLMVWIIFLIFSRVHATLHPALSVGRLVGHTLLFYHFYMFKLFLVILSYFESS